MRRTLAIVATFALIGTSLLVTAVPASADPSANAWASVRQCESSGDYSINTGNGYYGAYQFDLATWQSVGGTGMPNEASPAEQDYRALYLYRMRGWSPWICAALSGVTEDSSARSGRVPTRAEAARLGHGSPTFAPLDTSTCRVGSSTAPAWGGVVLTHGATYRQLICWQRQLGNLGYDLQGSGFFGAKTLAALHSFEASRGLPMTNAINQRTWVAAWGRSGGVVTRPAVHKPAVHKPVKKPVAKPAVHKPVKKPVTKPAVHKPVKKPVTRPAVHKPAGGVALFPGLTAAACHVGARTAPRWPGQSWSIGDYARGLACWQMQMGRRGYDLHGSGSYGAKTLRAAIDLQRRNGLYGSGLIGPKTWKAAWQGKAGH